MTAAVSAQTPLHDLLSEIIDRYREDRSGEVATYIPELGVADPEWFGICLVTTEGAVYEAGDSRQAFTIQSISKPFAYGLALEKLGPECVRQRVGVEPSGDAFNSISLQPGSGRPLNPMINAGAIAVSNMIYNALQPNAIERLVDSYSVFAGRPLDVDLKVYRSESDTGHRNRAIAHLLRNFGVVSDPVEQGLDLYFRQCSILTTCHDLAVMAATLANNGVNPLTDQTAISARYVEDVLSVMTTCGMYNYAGQWLYEVGVPAKSGVAGGIMAVLPGRMGIGTFSPRLDSQGNSVRGIRACQELSERFGLHLFNPHRSARSVIRNEMTLQYRTSSRVRAAAEARKLRELGSDAYLIELQGDLSFSAMEVVQRRAWKQLPATRLLLIDLTRVDSVDPPAMKSMSMMVARLMNQGCQAVFAGLQADDPIHAQLSGWQPAPPIFDNRDTAIEACEQSLLTGEPVGTGGNSLAPGGIDLTELDVAQDLNPAERDLLAHLLVRRTFAAGNCICRKGDPAGEIFFLTSGMVSVRLYTGPATFQKLAGFMPGSVFGEVAAIDRGPRSADVWVESDAECFCLGLDDFDRLGEEHPLLKIKLLQYLLRVLTIRLRRTNDLIGQLTG
ncbi:MAG TPA: glutaminase A [Tepidisphaeraceae bacterium]|nr:glutaminase A [Tepidisphaeraceae bacterium]